MFKSLLIFLLSLFCYGAESVKSGYDVLAIGYITISTDSYIKSADWDNLFQIPDGPISIGTGLSRQEYLKIGNLYYKVNSQAQLDESARRYREVNARNDLSIIHGRIYYQGHMLKYPEHVHGGDRPWGITERDDPPQGFRFGDYLIFMVQARLSFRDYPWDFVAYNLKDDTYAIHRAFGAWPSIDLFHHSEGVPDPRLITDEP